MALLDKTAIIVFLVIGIVWALTHLCLSLLIKRSRREIIKALDSAIEAAEEWQRVVDAHDEGASPEPEKEASNGVSGRPGT